MAVLLIPLTLPQPSEADWWQDLWQTRDQQGTEALNNGDPASAAELFKQPDWKGTAQFKNQQYDQAAQSFAQAGDANGFYNQGNALAHLGKIDEAINAYEQALTLNPDLENAKKNKQILEQLKKQQEQQEQQNQNNQQQQSNNNQDSQQDNNQQNSSQDQAQQDSSQQNQSQQSQDQQDSQKEQQGQDSNQQQTGQKNKNEQSNQGSKQEEDNDAVTESTPESGDNEEEQQGKQQQPDTAQASDEEEKQNAQQQQAQQLVESDGQDNLESQQVEGWLRRIPDDPSGLLRRKLRYQQRLKQFQQPDSEIKW